MRCLFDVVVLLTVCVLVLVIADVVAVPPVHESAQVRACKGLVREGDVVSAVL